MRTSSLGLFPLLATLAWSGYAAAQEPPPPVDPSVPPPAPAQPPGPYAPGPYDPNAPAAPAYGYPGAPAQQQPPPPAGPDASAGASWNMASGAGMSGNLSGAGGSEELPENLQREWKLGFLQLQNNVSGATGLLRLSEASGGLPGTFRISFLTSYFDGSGFLCNGECPPPPGSTNTTGQEDSVTRVGAHLGLSVTFLSFLEAFAGFHSQATSNDQGRPELLSVLGDTNLGLKGFLPIEPDQLLMLGGQAELMLLNGTGSVGIDGGGTSFALRALAGLDFYNRLNPKDRVPVRAHLNLGYKFDNSGTLVESVEERRGNFPITRIERFGLDINKVDSFSIGIGGDFPVHDVIRPLLEWSIDIPVNRQGYTCNLSRRFPGDVCLGNDSGFSTTPSRLTVGARVYPKLPGLELLAAVDIGTGATSDFMEEVRPELPWNLWLGLGFAVDTKPPDPIIQRVEVERPAPPPAAVERYVTGVVVEKGAGTPIPSASVRFDGRAFTGMITGEDGTFRTSSLPAGTYTFNVTAAGYRDGQCVATLPEGPGAGAAAGAPPGPYTPPGGQPGMTPPFGGQPDMMGGQPGMTPPPGMPPAGMTPPGGQEVASPSGPITVQVQCELEALPKVGNVLGALVEAESGRPVPGATVKITDRLNRELELSADASGAFRFENVPPGPVKITVSADGYLSSVTELEVKAREDLRAQIAIAKRPAKPNVTVTFKEVKLAKQVHFQHDSAEILPDSMSLVQEIADVMKSHPELRQVEIQGHTDNTGNEAYNQRLSQERADAVRKALVNHGVEDGRLVARGYGQTKQLVPNTSDANRAKNRRVQLMIIDRAK